MSQFVVSARKYRPITFDSVVGQSHVTQTLQNAIRSNHLAHAFLFTGPRGVGKTTCARILAKVLNCQQPSSDIEPCDVCVSCKSFNENASLNIHELDAASNNSVEHIRSLIDQVRFAPQQGKYKIYIIDEVHMLSSAAFNAFLKTLEEPPSYAIFILATTEKHKIIPTILSRCQIFDFNRIQISDMSEHLRSICMKENIQAEEEALHIIAQKADGALRDALSIFDRIVSFSNQNIQYKDVIENLNILDYDYYFGLVDAFLEEDYVVVLKTFDQILNKGFEADIFMNGLAEHLRNLLICKDAQTISLLEVTGNLKNRYMEQAKICAASHLISLLQLSSESDIHYKQARNKRLHVEVYLLKMVYVFKATQIHFQTELNTVSEKKKSVVENLSLASEIITQESDSKIESPDTNKEIILEKKAEQSAPQETEVKQLPKLNLSKSSLLETLKNEIKKEEQPGPKASFLEWNVENIFNIWEDYVSTIDSPSMQVLYKKALINLDPTDIQIIQVTVQSNRAQDAIARDMVLIERYRQGFDKPGLQFKISVIESEEDQLKPKQKPQTDRDKFQYFSQLNPHISELQKTFELYPPDYNPKKNK